MSNTITWAIDATIKDGKKEALAQFLAGAAENVKANEPNTLVYEFYVSEDGSKFHALESYASGEDAKAHVVALGSGAATLMECIDITSFTVYGDASDELRATIAGWQPTYFANFGGFRR